jgi:hypothetical protein
MATLSSDTIQVYFELMINEALTGVNTLSTAFTKLKTLANDISAHRRMRKELHSLGLRASKTGQFVDILTGKFVKQGAALERLNKLQREGTIFGKSASEIGGVRDATPRGKQDSGQAQQLINAVSAEAIIESANAFHKMDTAVKDTSASMTVLGDQGKDIGVLMGLLFGGMTMQRWGQSIMRFVLPPMQQIEGYVSEGTKKVNAMNAAFEFLKFSMFETFTQTALFRGFVDLLIKATNWLSSFVAQHPMLVSMVAVLGGTLAAAGWFMQIVGGFFQFGMLWKILANTSTSGGAIKGLEAFTKQLDGTKGALTGLSRVVGVGLIAKGFWEGFNFLGDDGDLWDLMEAGLFIGLGALFLGAGVWSIPITIIAVVTLTAIKMAKNAPKAITMREFGLSVEEYEEILAVGPDSNMHIAMEKGFQGTVVPSYVEDSWTGFANTVGTSAGTISTVIDEDLIQGTFPLLDTALIDIGTSTQTNVINTWDNWEPKTKTLKIKVEKSGGGGPDFETGTKSYSGSVTGG